MTPLLLIALLLPGIQPTVDAEALVHEAAHAFLLDAYPEAASRLEVRVDRVVVNDLKGPVRIAPLSAEMPRALSKVNVLTQGNAGWERAGWALLYFSHYDSVAVPVRDVERGSEVLPEDIASAWVETTRFHGKPLASSELRQLINAAGAVAERPLKAGRPLKHGDVRAPWDVRTGEPVRVQYDRGGFRLELQSQARESGSTNDEIRVFCPATQSTYRVRITGPGHADWLQTL